MNIDHAHPVSPRDTDLAHFISSVKFNASSDSPADVVRMAQLGATDGVRTVIPSKENQAASVSLYQTSVHSSALPLFRLLTLKPVGDSSRTTY